ncbi:hypothetical protein J0895_11530 [Phormidium pseudopriestleyi FRX01]|uniref:DUF3368 domain-containing protein n=1 Tax=Phormidium pseudopriestleyi FRX01 TaxID=1759528 RepID=A0ABS3FRI3_9CYAN|nr:hypothetical protein [Phormidium pseudopriestleyi]MBO0349729.1 hypothetical protein [Phormidium pseudopriestleyi FRX01]
MIVVSNTTPISELAKIGRLNLLPDLFGQIIIPQKVYDELTTGRHPAASQVPLKELLDALIAGGKRISPKLYREVLATAGE